MTDRKPRQFTGSPAVRASIQLWIGLYGPSGSGKTYSALRLAKGIQSVTGGKIAVGDTENGRALHYASEFDFHHYPFDPPFEPASYLDLLEQMVADGVNVAVIDSASHEHEGKGGVLEMHDAECERMMARSGKDRDKVQMAAWIKPKEEHRKMWMGAQRLPIHILWCFRAKDKLDVRPGKAPVSLGFMPIGAEDLVYEMTMRALLLPGAEGMPTWRSKEPGESQMIKLPGWARQMLRDGHRLDEEFGSNLATWAKGDTRSPEERRADVASRAELYTLYDRLSDERKARLVKAIANRDAIAQLAQERVVTAIEFLRKAVAEQETEHDQ